MASQKLEEVLVNMIFKKRLILFFLIGLLVINLTSIISAEEFGYNLLESGKNLNPSTNFSLTTVNASEIWITAEGNLDNVPDLYPTLDLRYLSLSGDNANQNININPFNFSAENITSNRIYTNHIAEKTTGHDVVFDNDVDLGTNTIFSPFWNNKNPGGLKVGSGLLYPASNGLMDLGTSTAKWKDIYLSGDANIGGDVLVDGNGSFLRVNTSEIYNIGGDLKIQPDGMDVSYFEDVIIPDANAGNSVIINRKASEGNANITMFVSSGQDPVISLRGTDKSANIFIDNDASLDSVRLEGRTEGVATELRIQSKTGYSSVLNLYSDAIHGSIAYSQAGNFVLQNFEEDGDYLIKFDDGVAKQIALDVSENKWRHDDNTGIDIKNGTIEFDYGNIESAKGNITLSNGRIGIGTSAPTHELNVVGNLNVTGNSYLGNSYMENITAHNLTLSGDAYVGGDLQVGKNITLSNSNSYIKSGDGGIGDNLYIGVKGTLFNNFIFFTEGFTNTLNIALGTGSTAITSANNILFTLTAAGKGYTFSSSGLGGWLLFQATTAKMTGAGADTISLLVEGNVTITKNLTTNLHYGEMYYHNHEATELNFAVDGRYYNMYMDTADNLNGFSYVGGVATNSSLTAQVDGLYKATYSAIGDGQNNHIYISSVFVNQVNQENCDAHRKMTAGGDVVTMVGDCFIRLSIDDEVTLRVADVGSTGTGNYYGANLNLLRIGD